MTAFVAILCLVVAVDFPWWRDLLFIAGLTLFVAADRMGAARAKE